MNTVSDKAAHGKSYIVVRISYIGTAKKPFGVGRSARRPAQSEKNISLIRPIGPTFL